MAYATWIKAAALTGTPTGSDQTYPCVCWRNPRSCGSQWCDCWGRPDPFAWAGCCAPTFTTEAYQQAATAYALRKSASVVSYGHTA